MSLFSARRRNRGFTLVELVVIIILLGILAVTALPRLSGSSEFRAVQLRDEVRAALRYAQKTAVSHRRKVCVTVAGNELSLKIDPDSPEDAMMPKHCNAMNALPIPGGQASVAVSGVALTIDRAFFYILPSGRLQNSAEPRQEFAIDNGTYKVWIWAETGHVE